MTPSQSERLRFTLSLRLRAWHKFRDLVPWRHHCHPSPSLASGHEPDGSDDIESWCSGCDFSWQCQENKQCQCSERHSHALQGRWWFNDKPHHKRWPSAFTHPVAGALKTTHYGPTSSPYPSSNPATTSPLCWPLIQIDDQLARPIRLICGKKFVLFVWWENSSNLISSDSRSCEAHSRPWWPVHVCRQILSIRQTFFLISWFSPCTSWEFVQSIGYEYAIITGRRKLTWTSPVCMLQPHHDRHVHLLHRQLYIVARWLTLFLITIEFVTLNKPHGMNCQVWNFAFLGPCRERRLSLS